MSTTSKAVKGLKDYAGTAVNTVIVLGTTGIEQITTVAIYRCPCVEPSQLGRNCNEAEYSLACAQTLNYSYGLSFIFAPAFAFFIFSAAANPTLWKVLTGYRAKTKKHKLGAVSASWTVLSILFRALISPITWVCIALIDGKYLACSITPLPYVLSRPTEDQQPSCEDLPSRNPEFSNAFHNSRTLSQIIGSTSIAGLLLIGFLLYCVTQCTFPLTFYHAKYYQLYRNHEQSEFDDEMNKKAQKNAENNVKKFLAKRRDKNLWDGISSVFQFHRDEKHLALYSKLHKWAIDETEKEELLSVEHTDAEQPPHTEVATTEV